MTLSNWTGRRMLAVVCAVLGTGAVVVAQSAPRYFNPGGVSGVLALGTRPGGEPSLGAPPVQSQGPNFGVSSSSQIEIPLSATGGDGTYVWSIIAGSLPPGLALRTDPGMFFPPGASAGLIGVATTPGTYNFTLRVSSGGFDTDQACFLQIVTLVGREGVLPDAFVGEAYSASLGALGNGGPVTWNSPANLPPGLTLNSAGALSGTPTTAGYYNVGFTLSDGTNAVFSGVSFNVSAVNIPTPGMLPNATQGAAYNATVTASGGTGPYTFSPSGLPNGLSMSSAGVISGTVNATPIGKYQVNITTFATTGGTYNKWMSIDVIGTPAALPQITPSVSGATLSDCTLGVFCAQSILVINGGTAPFTWIASGLPPGMAMRFGAGTTLSRTYPGDAELWGTPTALGQYFVQLTVTDAVGATATNTFPLAVRELMMTPSQIPNATIDTAYAQTLRVIGGTGPYTAALTSKLLPAGIALNGGAHALSGTPLESGQFNPEFTYTDSASHSLKTATFMSVTGAGAGTISINSPNDLGSRTTGSGYTQNLQSCCSPVTWSLIGGSLPPGITLSAGGVLSGTLTTSGTYTFLVKATASPATNYAARQFTLNVTPLSVTTGSPLPFGNVASPYSQTLTATGGTGAITWTLMAGTYLPPGLTLASNGGLSGTPTQSGQYQFTVIAADTASHTRTNVFTLSIYPVGGSPPVGQTQNANFGTFSVGQIETALTATGGTGPYTWSVISGSLPPGLSIRTDVPTFFPPGASAGLIGIATTPGTYSFTLRVTSGAQTADRASTLKVVAFTRKDATFPEAFVGVAYSYGMTALNNAGSVTWTATSTPPAGLALSPSGVLSGTPATPGFYNFNVSANDTVDTIFRSVNINVFAVRITTAGMLPNATQNAAYTTTINAAGGSGGYTFTAQCCLPNGLTLSAAGTISGTVNTGPGKYGFTVTAKDSSNVTYSKSMAVDVIGVPPALPTIKPYGNVFNDCTIGVPCTAGISVQSGGTAPFAWGASGLPPGMSIRTGSGTTSSFIAPGDGELWGNPTAAGLYSVSVMVTDFNGATATKIFPLRVSPLRQTKFLPNGTIAVPYSQSLRVIGGTGPYTGALTTGQLPSGVTLNPSTLLVSGTPAENGNFNPTVTYTDAASNTLKSSSSLFISGPPSGTININTNGNLGTAETGAPYSNQLSACCAGTITWSLTSGALPAGVTLSTGGLLSGTPSVSATYTFLLRAADSSNAANYAARQFTLTVAVPVPSPDNLVATGRTDTQLTVQWNSNGNTNFTVDYLGPAYFGGATPTCGDFPPHSNIFETTTNPVTIVGLTAFTWYHIHVHTIDSGTAAGSTNIIIVRTRTAGSGFEAITPGSPDYIICGSGGPPVITTQPQSQTIPSGQTATMTVAATGSEPLTAQWYVGTSGDTSNPIGGATSGSYTTPPLSSTTSYWVRVTNPLSTADSNTAVITVVTCTFSLSAPSASVPSTLSSGSVMLTASASACGWTAVSNNTFITVTSPGSGTGSTTVLWATGANTTTSSRTGTITIAGLTFTITQAAASAARRVPNDFNHDGVSDLGVFRANLGRFLIAGQPDTNWGAAGDMPVAGDFNGDGNPDIAVFRPANGTWYINGGATIVWGAPGDIPVPGDYDGNGTTDIAVFRPSAGIFYIRDGATVAWGLAGDLPAIGDYNGDGIDDIAVYRPATGTWYIRNGATVVFGFAADVPVPADYNGDGTTDIAVFRPATGTWIIKDQYTQVWGAAGDVPVPLDRNGDGRAELGVFRRAGGIWYFKNHVTDASETVPFGTIGDMPLGRALPAVQTPWGDYDGDRKADLTVFRPSTGDWVSLRSLSGMTDYTLRTWGLSTDVPVGRDYDGDGKIDPAVYRPSLGRWFVLQSSTNYSSYIAQDWGLSTDTPVPADYDGDGKADFAVFRPSIGRWVILLSSSNNTSYVLYDWGLSGDIPVPADFDGDGRADVAVFRPSTGRWYVLNRLTGAFTIYDWGLDGDVPVAADFDGDGKADIAVFRPSTGRWYIKSSIDGSYQILDWGLSGDYAVAADYDSDGKADVAVFRPSTGMWYVRGLFNRSWGLSGDIPALKNP